MIPCASLIAFLCFGKALVTFIYNLHPGMEDIQIFVFMLG